MSRKPHQAKFRDSATPELIGLCETIWKFAVHIVLQRIRWSAIRSDLLSTTNLSES